MILNTNCIIPMSDQDIISPHNIDTISIMQVMRMNKNINLGSLVAPIPNSPNQFQQNCIAEGKENY